jgi:hypothetical protein
MRGTLQQRFDAKWQLDPETGCWLWTASVRGGCYGTIRAVKHGCARMRRASHIAWELYRGPIPEGAHVLHHCDTPACVNPEHLFLGDHAGNMADRDAKGRTAKGEDGGGAKLSEKKARAILALRGRGLSQNRVAAEFGVRQSQISRIWHGKRWAHLQGAKQ